MLPYRLSHHLPRAAVALPPVSDADVALWLRAVPHLEPDSPRAAYYVKCWNVADKIRRAQAAGHWPPAPYTGP